MELDTCSTYHISPRRELYSSFEELDGGVISFGDGHTRRIEGVGTVCFKLFDETMRELKV